MTKISRSLLLCCVLVLVVNISVTNTVYAEPVSVDNTLKFDSKTLFKIPGGDISRIFLGQFFGTVGDSGLTGSGSIMPAIFEAFNTVVLGFGSLIVVFTLVVSVFSTANEGSNLGKKWSSMWLPMRTTLGIGMLLPIKGGYSLLQAMLMWSVMQGIGIADYVWTIGAQTALESPMDATSAAVATEGLREAGKIFQVLVCMEAVNKINRSGSVRMVINPDLLSPPIEHRNQYIYKIGSLQSNNGVSSDACGEISWPIDKDPDLRQARLEATRTLIRSLAISANGLVEFGTNYVNIADLANAATTYVNIINEHLLTKDVENSEHMDELIGQGWMLAGAFYYHLVQQNNEFQANQALPDTEDNTKNIGIGSDQAIVNRYLKKADAYISQAQSQTGIDAAAGEGVAVDFTAFDSPLGIGDQDAEASISQGLSSLKNKMNIIVGWWQGFFTHSQDDPLLSIQQAGQTIVSGVEIIWIATAIIVAAMGIASVCSAITPVFSVLENFLAWIIPLFTALLIFLYIAGALLAYYVPLIPFILFSFGALGWMLGVIEMITAAPVIALGIVYAGGGDRLGKAEPAVLFLTDLLVRPGLMILGLLASIVTVRIAVHYINIGFAITSHHIFAGGISYLTSIVALICIYTAIIVTVIKKCFTLIYLIPNRVMRWIGGESEAFETGMESERSMQGSFEKSLSPFAKVGGNVGSSAIKSKKKFELEAKQKQQKQGGQGLQST